MTQEPTSRAKPRPDAIETMGSLLYHAYVIEAEAEARYLELAEQMETLSRMLNTAVSKFRLSKVSTNHKMKM